MQAAKRYESRGSLDSIDFLGFKEQEPFSDSDDIPLAQLKPKAKTFKDSLPTPK